MILYILFLLKLDFRLDSIILGWKYSHQLMQMCYMVLFLPVNGLALILPSNGRGWSSLPEAAFPFAACIYSPGERPGARNTEFPSLGSHLPTAEVLEIINKMLNWTNKFM